MKIRYLFPVIFMATTCLPGMAKTIDQFSQATGVEEIIFAQRKNGKDPHWYANFSYYAEDEDRLTYLPGGRLCRVNLKRGDVIYLIDDPKGSVRDPVLNDDATTILFSYREGDSRHFHLYEIKLDGTGLRQLTDGDYDDIEPCYLPDGGIVFVSSRCKRWVNCWLTQVAILHRCDADGTNIYAISANLEHENTPWVLHNGQILYQRWEYIDRSQVHYHHLWITNPDGTGKMAYYGNQRPGTLMIDAKPIPGSDKIVAIFSPGHGMREHVGAVTVVDPAGGPDDLHQARTIHGANVFHDPWAFSEDSFMVAAEAKILSMDGQGRTTPLHELSEADRRAGYRVHEPRPVLARPREPIIPSRVKRGESTGKLILANVYEGRNMRGVQPGDIKKLLILEPLPKPINYTGGMDPLTYGGSFTLERVVGETPVEPDGSAYFELPAMRSFFFVALDENDLSVKRMQSFLSVQPGETTSCVGCHEQRTRSILPKNALMALRRAPSPIEPITDCPEVFDYPRDIQPILDHLCVDCHGYEKTPQGGPHAGRLILTGDRGPMFSHSYYMLTIASLFSDGRNQPVSNYPPRAIGSSASRILKMLDGSHHGVVASPHQVKMLRLWIEVGAPYPGTYAALGTGSIGGYAENAVVNADTDWPTSRSGAKVVDRRCGSCHQGEKVIPRILSDERGVSFWKPSFTDPRLKFSRHIVFNLTRPEKSLILLAPLAESAGGFGICRSGLAQAGSSPAGEGSTHLFATTDDPDYKTLLAMVISGKQYLEKAKRFDMPGFQPRRAYLREMKRYGVLPTDWRSDSPVDPYRLDQQYWESLWYAP